MFICRHLPRILCILIAIAMSLARARGEETQVEPFASLASGLQRIPTEELPLPQVEIPEVLSEEQPVPPLEADSFFHYGVKARSYYFNDQRLEFTGLEATFGVEGVLAAGFHQQIGEWEHIAECELFVNQPFERNIFIDSPMRASFAHNFDVDILQISQLYLAAQRGNLHLAAGRIVTPFGRFYFPNYLNSFADSPFIRSEAILFRETGIMARWEPGIYSFTAALTNGGPDRDSNSSKALIARAGLNLDQFAAGASVKMQDGIGSEDQKMYNNHVGLDAMWRSGPWTLSGEAIYDEYGARRPGLNLDDIVWGRSVYFRELHNPSGGPLTGFGYYVNLGYDAGGPWMFQLNYGDYFPQQQLGVRTHDLPIHRGLLRAVYRVSPNWEIYGTVLKENDGNFGLRPRLGTMVLAGVQFVF